MNDNAHLNVPRALAGLWADTQASGFAMASEPLAGALLRTLAASKPAGRFLELGSGTGLSTAWLLEGMDSKSLLMTVDNDQAALSVVRRHLGDDPRLTVVCEDADKFLHALCGQQFDFIFADTWAGKYRLLDEALALLAPAGFYIVDDMLPQANWPDGHAQAAADLIAVLERHESLRVTKLSWASGMIVACKI